MKFASRFDGLQKERSRKAAKAFVLPARTKQAFKDDCDINLILKRYAATGVLPDTSKAALAQYGDFGEIPSYQDALNRVMSASDMFSQLPASLRFKFQNDPGRLLAFLSDAKNREEAIELGLVVKPTPQEPVPAPNKPQASSSVKTKGKPATSSEDSSDDE